MKKIRRKLIVDGYPFLGTVNETTAHIKIRCYSMKSTYFELIFKWGTISAWAVNYFQPSVATAMIQHAIRLGWKYQLEKQIVVIPANESEKWLENAGIIDYSKLNQYLLEHGYHNKNASQTI